VSQVRVCLSSRWACNFCGSRVTMLNMANVALFVLAWIRINHATTTPEPNPDHQQWNERYYRELDDSDNWQSNPHIREAEKAIRGESSGSPGQHQTLNPSTSMRHEGLEDKIQTCGVCNQSSAAKSTSTSTPSEDTRSEAQGAPKEAEARVSQNSAGNPSEKKESDTSMNSERNSDTMLPEQRGWTEEASHKPTIAPTTPAVTQFSNGYHSATSSDNAEGNSQLITVLLILLSSLTFMLTLMVIFMVLAYRRVVLKLEQAHGKGRSSTHGEMSATAVGKPVQTGKSRISPDLVVRGLPTQDDTELEHVTGIMQATEKLAAQEAPASLEP